MAKDRAEALIEEYLTGRGIGWEYERRAGVKAPDYWLDLPSRPVVEMHHVTATLDGPGGAFDVYKPLRKAVKRKAPQGKDLDGDHPFVIGLWAPEWPTDPLAISGALFGRLTLSMPVDPRTGTAVADQARLGFGRDAELHQTQHRHVSAIAVIHSFNPGVRAAEEEIDRRLAEARDADPSARAASVVLDVYGRRGEAGLFDAADYTVRIETFHNMHATTPLPLDVFDGPFDEQHDIAEGRYTTVFRGARYDELPP